MKPPLLPHERSARFWVAGLAAAALVVVAILPRDGVPLPGNTHCAFKAASGLPCPLCGGTRAASAFVRGDWQRGLSLNPIAAPVVLGVVVVGLFAGIEALRGRRLVTLRRDQVATVGGLAVAVAVVMWLPHLARALRSANPDLIDPTHPVAARVVEVFRAERR